MGFKFGIQIALFQNLVDLNLSSNNIEDISQLDVLTLVQDLNLSCNKINKVSGLKGMLSTVKKINLSHNRIASLQYFGEHIKNGQMAPNLFQLDFNDNYIGDIEQI